MAEQAAPAAGEGISDHVPFRQFGTPGKCGPLIFAVPHAGRYYSPALLARSRVPETALARLEDRLADHLVSSLIAQGHYVLVATLPRALIDLNRDEREVDHRGLTGAPWGFRGQPSAKVRGGLGLVPERLSLTGPLWHGPLPYSVLRRRIDEVHRPYHSALGAALATARRIHGAALLIDVHSMPPLRPVAGVGDVPPRIVIGDRFGRSATDRLTDLCADVVRRHRIPVAINSPYSGNHILERHGRPNGGVHAIQIEVDRSLYLQDDLMTLGHGLPAMQQLFSELAVALLQELGGPSMPLAAE